MKNLKTNKQKKKQNGVQQTLLTLACYLLSPLLLPEFHLFPAYSQLPISCLCFFLIIIIFYYRLVSSFQLISAAQLQVGLPGWHSGKEPACQCRRCKSCGFDPWIQKIPWSRKWQSAPVLFPGETPWTKQPVRPQSRGRTESDMTEQLNRIKEGVRNGVLMPPRNPSTNVR